MKSIVRPVAIPAVLTACAILAACGGDSESSSAPSSSASNAPTPSVNQDALKGALIFKKTCATCHGADAKGMPDNGPDMHNNEFVKTNSDDQLLEYVVTGRVVEDGADVEINTGFVFHDFTQEALVETIERATERYTHYRQWRPLMINAMEQNFSWNQSARSYEDVYQKDA